LYVAFGDRSEFRHRSAVACDDEALTSLDALEQGRKMRLGFIGADLVQLKGLP
jgi:hypothetical protein